MKVHEVQNIQPLIQKPPRGNIIPEIALIRSACVDYTLQAPTALRIKSGTHISHISKILHDMYVCISLCKLFLYQRLNPYVGCWKAKSCCLFFCLVSTNECQLLVSLSLSSGPGAQTQRTLSLVLKATPTTIHAGTNAQELPRCHVTKPERLTPPYKTTTKSKERERERGHKINV